MTEMNKNKRKNVLNYSLFKEKTGTALKKIIYIYVFLGINLTVIFF